MIYFIYDSVNNVVKIGKSHEESLYSRLASLQTGNVTKLDLLGVMTGYTEKEAELHLKFDEYRIRGEWFEYNEEIKNYIETNKIEYDVKCTTHVTEELKKKWRDVKRNKRIDMKREYNWGILDNYFVLNSASRMLVSEVREIIQKKNIKGLSGEGYLPVSKVSEYFGLKESKTRINKKVVRVIKGLDVTKVS
jgi:hypothetical protein